MTGEKASSPKEGTDISLDAPEEISVALVRCDHLVTSHAFRTIFEIFLGISATLIGVIFSEQAAAKLLWLLFGVAGFTSILSLSLSVWFSRLARSVGSKPGRRVILRDLATITGTPSITLFGANPKIRVQTIEDYVRNVPNDDVESGKAAFSVTATPKEWEKTFLDWVNANRPYHPPLSDEALSRESIYREREDSQL